jgi:hypothetical protein
LPLLWAARKDMVGRERKRGANKEIKQEGEKRQMIDKPKQSKLKKTGVQLKFSVSHTAFWLLQSRRKMSLPCISTATLMRTIYH